MRINYETIEKFFKNTGVEELAEDILECAFYYIEYCGQDAYDAIYQVIDDEPIWDEDLWNIIQHYQSLRNADFNKATECFVEDLAECLEY